MGLLNDKIGATLLLFSVFVAQAVPTDYLVLSWSHDKGMVSEFHQVVDLPLQENFNLKKPQKGFFITLNDENGNLLEYISLKQNQFVRSEHHGFEHIDGQYIENETLVFVLRTNLKDAKTITLINGQSKAVGSYYLTDLVASAKTKGTSYRQKRLPPDNRINLLVMGDGYTNAQSGAFQQDADNVISYMKTIEPYKNYERFISFDQLFTASVQSGADHPSDPCADGAPDPQAPLFVNTAFDATFCSNGIQRLLTVNSTKVYTAAASVPNWDKILVIVNDSMYGGAGGAYSTISTHASADDVFIHEYGHSFTDLADEYTTPYPGYPACNDNGGVACEANVTNVTVANNIKWKYRINNATPIPTPDTSTYNNTVGLFQGARYDANNMYRSQRSCTMNTLGGAFCAVCKQAYVLKVYNVTYAQGGSTLSLIEPQSRVPANVNPTINVGVATTFSVDLLLPTHGLHVEFAVDGLQVSSGTASSSDTTVEYNYTPQTLGAHTVKVTVQDTDSPLVHSSQINSMPKFTRIWNVNVVDLIFANGFE